MPTAHPLPVPPALLSRACEQVDRRVCRLPFRHGMWCVDRDLVAAALEELNAEPKRALALRHRAADDGRVQVDGLDRRLAQRGFDQDGSASAVADVLLRAGIAQKSSVTDRRSRSILPGIRLVPAWTWTIVTTGCSPSYGNVMTGNGDPAAAPWTDLCPVCRAGKLVPVSGQHLYGMRETEFITCTSCKARFVPHDGRFRLVAIPKKQDPLQADLLNRSLTTEEWQGIAQGEDAPVAGRTGRCLPLPADRSARRGGVNREAGARLAVEAGGRTLYFTQLPLHVSRGRTPDLFVKRRETLREILGHPAYAGLAKESAERLCHYLDVPVGPFLLGLKERRDSFYWQFLNRYGDAAFCTLRTEETKLSEKKGVYVIASNGIPLATGAALHSFVQTVNETLGQVRPKDCYRDGEPNRCQINNLLCSSKRKAGIFIHPLDDAAEIAAVVTDLSARILAPDSGSADEPAGFT